MARGDRGGTGAPGKGGRRRLIGAVEGLGGSGEGQVEDGRPGRVEWWKAVGKGKGRGSGRATEGDDLPRAKTTTTYLLRTSLLLRIPLQPGELPQLRTRDKKKGLEVQTDGERRVLSAKPDGYLIHNSAEGRDGGSLMPPFFVFLTAPPLKCQEPGSTGKEGLRYIAYGTYIYTR